MRRKRVCDARGGDAGGCGAGGYGTGGCDAGRVDRSPSTTPHRIGEWCNLESMRVDLDVMQQGGIEYDEQGAVRLRRRHTQHHVWKLWPPMWCVAQGRRTSRPAPAFNVGAVWGAEMGMVFFDRKEYLSAPPLRAAPPARACVRDLVYCPSQRLTLRVNNVQSSVINYPNTSQRRAGQCGR